MIEKIAGRTRSAYNNAVNKEVLLSLRGGEFFCRPPEGIGPVKAELNFVDLPLEAGGVYTDGQNTRRNIVLTVEYRPDWSMGRTVKQLRKQLNKVFMPTNVVELDFTDEDGEIFQIKGVVESNEPYQFSKDPAVQISIICDDPYFRTAAGPDVFSIPINGPTTIPIDFEGDVAAGFIAEFQVVEPFVGNKFSIEFQPRKELNYFRIDGYAFVTGDVVRFSSVKGNRYVRVTRAGVTTDLLGYFSGSLVATKMDPGMNYLLFPQVGNVRDLKFYVTTLYGEM
jgi:hypothetical protein